MLTADVEDLGAWPPVPEASAFLARGRLGGRRPWLAERRLLSLGLLVGSGGCGCGWRRLPPLEPGPVAQLVKARRVAREIR